MNKELITKLISRAREASDNAYCPYTNVPIGCALLTEGSIYTGCNIESRFLSNSVSAGQVAVMKAISEGCTDFKAVCFYSNSMMPFPDGNTRQVLSEFNQMISVVVANAETYNLSTLNNMHLFPPELQEND